VLAAATDSPTWPLDGSLTHFVEVFR